MLESARKELNGARAKQQMVIHAFVQSERDVSEILDHVAESIAQVGTNQPASPTLRIVNGSTPSKHVVAAHKPVSTGPGESMPSGQRRILRPHRILVGGKAPERRVVNARLHARRLQHLHQLAAGRPPDNGVVNQHHPPVLQDAPHGVELDLHAVR